MGWLVWLAVGSLVAGLISLIFFAAAGAALWHGLPEEPESGDDDE